MEKNIQRFRLKEKGTIYLAIQLSRVVRKGVDVLCFYKFARYECERSAEHGIPRFVVPRRTAWRGREQVIEIPEGLYERID